MTDHEKLKALKKDLGLSLKDISEITGHSYDSVRTMLKPSSDLPRWVALVLYVWENKE